MDITWNADELEEIKKQTMKDLRPSYYSIQNRNLIQISEDFEGYLILQGADDKQKIITWMADVGKINNDTKDQNDLLAKYLEIRGTDADDRITELEERLNKCSEMQANLITDGKDPSRYGSIFELSLMIQSVTKSIDNIMIQREQAFHEKNVIAAVTNKVKSETVDDESKRELDSWKSILATYKGQTNKSSSKTGKTSLGGVF